jgi:hypothetical protein
VSARGTREGLRRFPVFAAATAGVLGGHWLTYALALAQPARRDAELSATGHGYLSVAGVTALVLVLLALGSALISALDARSAPAAPPRTARLRSLFLRLWLLQFVAFSGVEVAERLAAGAPLRDVVLGRVLAIGLIVHAFVAVVGALLLQVLHRAAAGLARLLSSGRTTSPPRVLASRAPRRGGPRVAMLAGATGLRGPPSP